MASKKAVKHRDQVQLGALARGEGKGATAAAPAAAKRGRGRPPAAPEKKTWPVVFARVTPELREQLDMYLARTRPRRKLEDVVAEALEAYLSRARGTRKGGENE